MATATRIVAALAAGTQETSLSLAHINFDFSLIKLEAPASFHGVGRLLSGKRKASAENGLSHITARKLGALFEQLLPSTPLLVDRYGSRASEIAHLSEGEETSRPFYGIFADQAGMDATSIWAAATSGTAAIAVHLLACMLARMFPGPEATSIWVELIEERKKKLACEENYRPDHISTLLAAQISIPREQLAEWDNSARSWLRVADETMTLQQNQLLLIIKNIHVPVNNDKGNLYQSVIAAWVRALEVMENLCRGVAQCVTPYEGNGELLLALASWHMYPDIDVLGSKIVRQKDLLIPPEAILTVGLECSPTQQDIGVYWSLPLAHFRFYGPPKTAAHSLCTDAERVPFGHFRFVALGCFFSNWSGSGLRQVELIDYAKLAISIYQYLTTDSGTKSPPTSAVLETLREKPNWLRDLSETCDAFLNANETDKVIFERLIGLGLRRGTKFLDSQSPLFGLRSFHDFFDILDGTEAKVLALRRATLAYDLSHLKPLIRYRNPQYNEEVNRLSELAARRSPDRLPDFRRGPRAKQRSSNVTIADLDTSMFSEQSDLPPDADSRHAPAPLTEFDEAMKAELGYFTYASDEEEPLADTEGSSPKDSALSHEVYPIDVFQSQRDHYDADPSSDINSTTIQGKDYHLPAQFYIYASVVPGERSSAKRSWEGAEIRNVPHTRWCLGSQQRDLSEKFTDEDILNSNVLNLTWSNDSEVVERYGITRNLVMGSPIECALFSLHKSFIKDTSIDDLLWALKNGLVDRIKLTKLLLSGKSHSYTTSKARRQAVERSALATVMETYAQFPKATIALKVIEKPLRQQKWVRASRHRKSRHHELVLDTAPTMDSEAESARSEVEDFEIQGVQARLDDEHNQVRGLLPLKPKRSGYFALLAAFESGTLDPDPAGLGQVMAMSSGDSLFVARHLLMDPWESQRLDPCSICRIRGNIGRPGIAMMVPPPELQMRPRDSTNWRSINHAPFDGELCDSFEGTSLHLSITDYNRPVDSGVHGVRDAETYFVEAYIQVSYKGKWIGDIDVISSLESRRFLAFKPPRQSSVEGLSCIHSAPNIRAFRIIAVDNWDEFIDNPKDGVVVRAQKNWMARLAAMSLSVQRQYKTIVLNTDDPVCWPCVRNRFELGSSVGDTTFIC